MPYIIKTVFKSFAMFILQSSETRSLLLCSPQPSVKCTGKKYTITKMVVSLSTFTGYWYFLGIGPPTSPGLFLLCKSCWVGYYKNQNISNLVEPRESALAKGKLEQVKWIKPEAAAKSAVGVPKVLNGRGLTSGFPEARGNMTDGAHDSMVLVSQTEQEILTVLWKSLSSWFRASIDFND